MVQIFILHYFTTRPHDAQTPPAGSLPVIITIIIMIMIIIMIIKIIICNPECSGETCVPDELSLSS